MPYKSRGTVCGVQLSVEYPDGTTKHIALASEHVSGLLAIVFDREMARTTEEDAFTQFDDWRNNPTMIIYRRSPDGAVDAIPFCSSNGSFPC